MIVHNREATQFGGRGRKDQFRGRGEDEVKEGEFPFQGLDRDRGFGVWKTVFKKESEFLAIEICGTRRKSWRTAHRFRKNRCFQKQVNSVLKDRT
jgi:hypothetical protein